MANYYCEYCGTKATSIPTLTSNTCGRHPNGSLKGKHKLYEGGEKSVYSCKYCGTTNSNMGTLTANSCSRHPLGSLKGKHSPAL